MMLHPTLYRARWVLPVSEPPIRNGAVLVDRNGLIEGVGDASSFESASAVEQIDLGEAAILPGLINVHTHPELSPFRGLLEDLAFHIWIPTLVKCKQAAQLTEEDYDVAARWTCVESLRAGITTLGATEDSGAALGALNDAGMRGVVFLETFGPAPEQAKESLRMLREKVEMHARYVTERVRIGVSPHAAYTVSDELYSLVGEYARWANLPVAAHAAEAEAEDLLVRDASGPFAAGLRARGIATRPRGRSTIDMFARVGLLDCAPLLIHAVRTSAEDRIMIRESGATVAHCPIANARLGHGIAPVVEAIESGIVVGIGTDSVASNNRLDLLEEARAAQTFQRARLLSASALPPEQLLRMVTIEGARVLGMADTVGTLTVGKAADLCAVALDRANTVPVTDPVAAVFHSARGGDVILTAVAGRVLFRGGTVSSLSEAELMPQMNAIGERLVRVRSGL
jgi:5-methylthioadenosine/S-adenosylhomocysteine deaminase